MPQNNAFAQRFSGETLGGRRGKCKSICIFQGSFDQKAADKCKSIILKLEDPMLCKRSLVHYCIY